MKTKDFLQLVTADGIRCIVVQTPVGMMQLPAHDVDEAARLAEWYDGKQKNVYFALSTFKETHTNDKGKERVKRKRNNVENVKSLWLDIDYKDCQPANSQGAVAALAAFLKASDWPKPTAMVSSGNGMHVYWPLSSPQKFEAWLPVAAAFKDLCQEHGLPADHACTADASRVLRPVGTHNWKDADNPKAVVWVGGSGDHFDFADISKRLGNPTSVGGRVRSRNGGGGGQSDLPSHLQRAVDESGGAGEYTKGNARTQNVRSAFDRCGVLKHILKTGGAEQDEPEWSATLTLLAHLDDGAKFVHPMSQGHTSYDADATMEKWQQKIEAVEEGTGPTLCKTFHGYHEEICEACPFYQSRKVKTPKSLAYMDPVTPASTQNGDTGTQNGNTPHLAPVAAFQSGQLPYRYRVGGNNDCIEKHIWNDETKQYEWEPVLRQVWELVKASRQIQSKDYQLNVRNTHGTNVSEFPIPYWQFGSDNELRKTICNFGASIVNQNEYREFKQFMQTWLDELREKNNVEDTTGQLGWIIDETDEDGKKVIGFATGTTAFYLDGTMREGVVAEGVKFKGIAPSFKPMGKLEPWKEAAKAIVDQGCDHIIMMMATAFAAPLMRFTDQPGAVVSLVSNDSAAGKSTALKLAQAVWGNPSHAPATMDDTHTVVKNKLAFLQNLPAYWDEVRGDEHKMHMFIQVCFQVAQGRDRERANSKAETIRAEEWQTLLAACSNESLFDLAAEKAAESNAGIYRIFEVNVDSNEYPAKDNEIMSMISQLQGNYGHAGLVYAKYLTENYERIENEVETMRLTLDQKVNLVGAERFWLAAITAMVLGAKYAGECGLVEIDTRRLLNYLINGLQKLRARAVLGKQRLSPRELIAAYAQQHQDGKITVDKLALGKGKPEVVLQGNHASVRKAMFVEAVDDNMMMVLKSDFKTWLWKSKQLKFNAKMIEEFTQQVGMIEQRSQLAAGTKYKLPTRSLCLIFNLNETEEVEND